MTNRSLELLHCSPLLGLMQIVHESVRVVFLSLNHPLTLIADCSPSDVTSFRCNGPRSGRRHEDAVPTRSCCLRRRLAWARALTEHERAWNTAEVARPLRRRSGQASTGSGRTGMALLRDVTTTLVTHSPDRHLSQCHSGWYSGSVSPRPVGMTALDSGTGLWGFCQTRCGPWD